ncbi:hypothetical protein P4124_21355 [Pseudomonas aeruginosa]|nr:hypothetical protein [Pseudomonas aeruginosa]
MLPVQTERLSPRHQGGPIYWLAEDADTGVAVGTVMGLNHAKAFQDPEGAPASGAWRWTRNAAGRASARRWCGTWSSTS